MRTSRRKTSAVYADFVKELSALARWDKDNQKAYSTELGRRPAGKISKRQLHALTESTFFGAFRAYENFVRELFILYCQEKPTTDNFPVKSYLKPRSFSHAEELIRSSMRFTDWNDPEAIIRRSDLFLRGGFPVRDMYTTNKNTFDDMKVLRNHIAHRSVESFKAYRRILQRHLRTQPLCTPEPGEFLLFTDDADPTKYRLQSYLYFLAQAAKGISSKGPP